VNTPEGAGIVTAVNKLKEEVTVELQNKQTHKFSADRVSSSFLGKIGLKKTP
jgi:hypothetical protein